MTAWRDFKTDPPPVECVILVWLEEALLGSRMAVACMHRNVNVIGGYFEYDVPKILKWRERPEAPEN